MSELVSDTRTFLRLFRHSGYKDMHIRLGDYEAFFASPDGAANPLLAGEVTAGVDAAPAGDPGADLIVAAPHIASFVSALPVGSTVAAGEAVARIELLGEEISVPADRAGTVSHVLAEAGALVEYSTPLVRLLAA
ncbi:biotin/lipoyl-containing protein [Novosphingobium colocasiae]|uniref:biotin/lipoyl-containing protein n=1 Tax=Novosphingobium colocasiae TaxID=1256513 RepID=UPI0035B4BCFB